jgi:hypothetical protein
MEVVNRESSFLLETGSIKQANILRIMKGCFLPVRVWIYRDVKEKARKKPGVHLDLKLSFKHNICVFYLYM